MPIPHDKCTLRVAKMTFLLLLMQHKFFRHLNAASQVYTLPDPDIFAFDKLVEGMTTGMTRPRRGTTTTTIGTITTQAPTVHLPTTRKVVEVDLRNADVRPWTRLPARSASRRGWTTCKLGTTLGGTRTGIIAISCSQCQQSDMMYKYVVRA